MSEPSAQNEKIVCQLPPLKYPETKPTTGLIRTDFSTTRLKAIHV